MAVARAHRLHRRRHAAQHRAGARGRGALRARRHVLPRRSTSRRPAGEARIRERQADARAGAARRARTTAACCRSSATCTRATSATSSRRWVRPRQGYPVVSRVLVAPRADRRRRLRRIRGAAERPAAGARRARRAADPDDRRGGRCARRWRHATSSPASSTGCRTSSRSRRACARRPVARRLAMEGLALTGAWVDRERGLVSTIVLEMGGSSDLCARLAARRAGRPDGPHRRADRDRGRRDRRAGGRRTGQRGAVLDRRGVPRRRLARCCTSPATRSCIDRYKVAEIEAAADVVVWCCDEAPGFVPGRPQDRSFVGNIVQAMTAYARGRTLDLQRPVALRMQTPIASSRSAPTG